jgi:hypothetical protein
MVYGFFTLISYHFNNNKVTFVLEAVSSTLLENESKILQRNDFWKYHTASALSSILRVDRCLLSEQFRNFLTAHTDGITKRGRPFIIHCCSIRSMV